MSPQATPESKGTSFTLYQLIGWFFGPGLTVLGIIIWGAVKINTLENAISSQAALAAEQKHNLENIQTILMDVRLQLAARIAPAPAPTTAQPAQEPTK